MVNSGIHSSVPILGFAAPSGTGKTTLLCELIPYLKAQSLHLGLIKHTHHCIQFDLMGTTQVALQTRAQVYADSPALSVLETHLTNDKNHHDTKYDSLRSAIAHYQYLPIDLLLIEGFKSAGFPKIELWRDDIGAPYLYQQDEHIIAIAGERILTAEQLTRALPQFLLQDIAGLASWIIDTIVKPPQEHPQKLPAPISPKH